MIGIGDGDQCRQVQYCIAILHGGVSNMSIAHVICEHIYLLMSVFGAVVYPDPRAETIVEYEAAHIVAGGNERLNEMGTDEPIRSSDQNSPNVLTSLLPAAVPCARVQKCSRRAGRC